MVKSFISFHHVQHDGHSSLLSELQDHKTHGKYAPSLAVLKASQIVSAKQQESSYRTLKGTVQLHMDWGYFWLKQK